MRQKAFYFSFVSDEVVVNDENVPAVSGAIERVEFLAELLRSLGPWFSSEHDNDVAEFTLKWASARKLDRNGSIVFDLEEIEPWYWRLGQVRLLIAGI